jgi:hypothetical protein
MTPEQERFWKEQDRSIAEYHSAENTARRRAEREQVESTQTTSNNERDNTLFYVAIFGAFAVLIAIAMAFPV